MTPTVGDQLREMFHADAQHAPDGEGLAEGAVRRVRRRRRIQVGAVALLAVLGTATGVLVAPHGRLAHRPASPPIVAAPSAPPRTGALTDPLTASCAFSPTAERLAERAFAFDGTITSLGPGRTNRRGYGRIPLASATFEVHEWFKGGHGGTATADIEMAMAEDGPPAYGVGTRLLVSGEPRWGGEPLDNAIVWGCGFTRYYDPETVTTWQKVFR